MTVRRIGPKARARSLDDARNRAGRANVWRGRSVLLAAAIDAEQLRKSTAVMRRGPGRPDAATAQARTTNLRTA
jgi:hypothetical protein